MGVSNTVRGTVAIVDSSSVVCAAVVTAGVVSSGLVVGANEGNELKLYVVEEEDGDDGGKVVDAEILDDSVNGTVDCIVGLEDDSIDVEYNGVVDWEVIISSSVVDWVVGIVVGTIGIFVVSGIVG